MSQGPLSRKSLPKRGPRPLLPPRKVHRYVPGTVLVLYAGDEPPLVLIYMGEDDYIYMSGAPMVDTAVWSSYVDTHLDEEHGWRATVYE